MEIRPFEISDTQQVTALWKDIFPVTAPHHDARNSIQAKMEHDNDLFYVAIEEGELVGTILGGYDGHRGWVYSLAVAKSHRRQGIGGALLLLLEDRLSDLGCAKLNLQVLDENQEVVEFYQHVGYQVEERVSMGKRLYD